MADIITRRGLRLCSHRDPVREAQTWVRSLKESSGGAWIVLGIGAGYHLLELRKQNPQSLILAVDFDIATIKSIDSNFQTHILDPAFDSSQVFEALIIPVLALGFRVISFRPSWAGLETHFARIENLLLGRHGECNPLIASDAGLKKSFFSVPENLEINIKSMTQDEPLQPSVRWRRLRALRELIA